MSVNVWFVLAPWLAFGAVLIGAYFWQRTSPHQRRPRRRTRRDTPHQSSSGGEQDADLRQYESTSS